MPIELAHITFSYQSNAGTVISALHDVSLRVNDGDFVGIMGHTGCGKTTLVQLISGLLTPTSGKILLNGKDINARAYDRSELRKNIGLVFQYPEYQLFETTVEKDVAFGLKHSGLDKNEVASRVKWALQTMEFSFEDIRSQSPLSLSGGEKRRVAIAGVLVTKPRVLIFDEPIAGLDPLSRLSFLKTVSRLNREEGIAIIIISHNTDALAEYAKRILVLDNGRLIADGAVKEIFSNAEWLESLHLSSSTPRIIGKMLSNCGLMIPDAAITYSELLSALKSHLAGGDKP